MHKFTLRLPDEMYERLVEYARERNLGFAAAIREMMEPFCGEKLTVQGYEMPRQLIGEIYSFLRTRQKIQAIKRAREILHLGLKEAKDLVDEIDASGKWRVQAPMTVSTPAGEVPTHRLISDEQAREVYAQVMYYGPNAAVSNLRRDLPGCGEAEAQAIARYAWKKMAGNGSELEF